MCKTTVIETVWHWHKDKGTDQQKRIERLEINYRQLTLERLPRSFNAGKNNLFNKQFWDNWISNCKRINLDPYFTPHIKIRSKWINNLNIRTKTLITQQEEDNPTKNKKRT